MLITIIILSTCLLLAGCKGSDTLVLPEIFRDTVYRVQHHHDSTYVDRWHTVEVKGDTVFKTETKYIYRYLTRVDTAYRYVEKPVEVIRTETVEVEKPLRWWQKALMWGGVGFALAIFVASLSFFYYIKRK